MRSERKEGRQSWEGMIALDSTWAFSPVTFLRSSGKTEEKKLRHTDTHKHANTLFWGSVGVEPRASHITPHIINILK